MPTEVAIGPLSALLRALGRPASALSLLLAHAEAVENEADRLGLVSAADSGNVLSRHTADSLVLALARRPQPGERWADVGSGAGFPGLPLAICFPRARFTLIEPQQRRAGFLDLQVSNLGLENVLVASRRAEELEEQFDVVVARALARPKDAMDRVFALVRPGGEAIVAIGHATPHVSGARIVDASLFGVDSPGRLLMMTRPSGE